MNSISGLIDKFGGSTAAADALGMKLTTVASWKSRNSIPIEHWRRLIKAATDRNIKDVTVERLMELHEVPAEQQEAS